jgi:hypothetical protein
MYFMLWRQQPRKNDKEAHCSHVYQHHQLQAIGNDDPVSKIAVLQR